MSRFEKILIKYMSYGFVAGLFYSFLTNRVAVQMGDGTGGSITIRSQLDDYVMDSLFNAALFSVIIGAFFAIWYWADRWVKPEVKSEEQSHDGQ